MTDVTGIASALVVVERPWPFGQCPSCSNPRFIVKDDGGLVAFHCIRCESTWRYTLGTLVRTEPTPLPRQPSG